MAIEDAIRDLTEIIKESDSNNFSTTTLTVINNSTYDITIFCPSMTQFNTNCRIEVGHSSTVDIKIILYNGTALIYADLSSVELSELNGNITPSQQGFIITGDCSIKLADKLA